MAEIDMKFGKKVVKIINELREDPRAFIKYLESDLKHFDGNCLEVPDNVPLDIEEGPYVVSEHFV